MTWLTGPKLLLVLAFCQCVSSAQDTEIVEVLYPSRTIHAAKGTSVNLTCRAKYNFKLCGHVQVAWCAIQTKTDLTDHTWYTTTVNETVLKDGIMRLRQVMTEIIHLTMEDNGAFQCNAKCERGEMAQGHFIRIHVTD
ncbi:uncharacterized protein LOC139913070 [Centroberyx gerrardi]|uniref:uncharacterized protein n=1 Tax=Centroberyx gerrardi TaxID=166262 RepID=UPI003AAD65DD